MIRLWLKIGAAFAAIIIVVGFSYPLWSAYVWPIHNERVAYQGWRILHLASNHEIEGYPSRESVQQGQGIDIHVNSDTAIISADIFRLGWYNGEGGFKVQTLRNIHASKEALPTPDPATGLVRASWRTAFSITVPNDWKSGIYLVRLENNNGLQSYVPFVVADKKPASPYLFVHTDITDEAYNAWNGSSLYRGAVKDLHTSHAVEVSFDRPFIAGGGAGNILLWEYPMIRFLEKNGYVVSYATSSDVDANPHLLQQFKGVIITGHDEYWTKNMFDGYQQAVDHGVSLLLFSANTAYRQIRLQDRVITGYKDAYKSDPEFDEDEEHATTEWRSAVVHRPESVLTGAMFITQVAKAFPYVITNPNHWVFAGTGVSANDSVRELVGYECDRVFPEFPKPHNLEVLSNSPVISTKGVPEVCQSTIYQAPSGAYVFNAGTIQWSSALDSWHSRYGESDIIQKITNNLLRKI